MKKFMKVSAIIALIFIVTGFVMVLTAGVIKGPAVYVKLRDSLQDSPDKRNTEQSFKAGSVTKLNVEAGACQIEFVPSRDGDFHVTVQGADGYDCYVEENTLCINGVPDHVVKLVKDRGKIILAVPEGYSFEQIELSLGAGQITGNAELSAEKVEIELGAGDISLSALNTDSLDAEVGMGSLALWGDIRREADVECAMGTVEMQLAGTATDFNYQIEIVSGSVNIGGQSVGAMAQERDIDNDAPKDFRLECAMGSIDLTFLE